MICCAVPVGSAVAPAPPPARVAHPPPSDAEIRQALLNPWDVEPVPAACIDTETLWLARLMYSETKQPDEQELVAWVVRNRAETGFRGRSTIALVAQDPYQFTAFVAGTETRRYYTSLTSESGAPGWRRTLALAYYVRHADASMRPFSLDTRHFYSERSTAHPDSFPVWTLGQTSIKPLRPRHLDAKRFRFYAGIL